MYLQFYLDEYDHYQNREVLSSLVALRKLLSEILMTHYGYTIPTYLQLKGNTRNRCWHVTNYSIIRTNYTDQQIETLFLLCNNQ